MDPEPYRAKKPEPHSVPFRKAQTVLRTVPLHLNRTPYRPVKFDPSLLLYLFNTYIIFVLNNVICEKLQIPVH